MAIGRKHTYKWLLTHDAEIYHNIQLLNTLLKKHTPIKTFNYHFLQPLVTMVKEIYYQSGIPPSKRISTIAYYYRSIPVKGEFGIVQGTYHACVHIHNYSM